MSKGKGASSKSTDDMRPSAPAKTATSVPPPPPGSPHRTSASMTCVSSLSLTSSPASANGSNMVSPDKTMFSARAMRASHSPDRPSSKHQSRTVHGDGKERAVRCLGAWCFELSRRRDNSKHQAPKQQARQAGGRLCVPYVAQNGQGARLLCGCHVEGTGGQDIQERLVRAFSPSLT